MKSASVFARKPNILNENKPKQKKIVNLSLNHLICFLHF